MLSIQGFPAGPRRDLNAALTLIRQRLRRPPGPMPGDLLIGLRNVLSAPRPVVDLVYGGAAGACKGPFARSAGYRVLLCQKAFRPEGSRPPRLPAVLFHELIHIVRGWELDAEAYENAWFSTEEGAEPPTRQDWGLFKEDRYEGWWVRVDRRTRLVTDYADRRIVTFPAPTS
jgi:hypothetical protein